MDHIAGLIRFFQKLKRTHNKIKLEKSIDKQRLYGLKSVHNKEKVFNNGYLLKA